MFIAFPVKKGFEIGENNFCVGRRRLWEADTHVTNRVLHIVVRTGDGCDNHTNHTNFLEVMQKLHWFSLFMIQIQKK